MRWDFAAVASAQKGGAAEWKKDFDNFCVELGDQPLPELIIRINAAGAEAARAVAPPRRGRRTHGRQAPQTSWSAQGGGYTG